MTVKDQKSAFERGKFGQVAMEEQNCGNGRAKSKVPLEKVNLAKWQWKSGKVAMEELKCGNGRADS